MSKSQSAPAPYPVVEVRGSPREMGVQHGQQARERVGLMLERYFGQSTRRLIGGADGEQPVERDAIEYAESLLPLSEAYAPDLVAEVRGIAEGSHHDSRELFALQHFVDWGGAPVSAPTAPAGCSTVVAVGSAHRQGHTLLGWNDDMSSGLVGATIILRSFPDEGPAITGICFAGTIPECGATRERAVACNHLLSPHGAEGVPYLFIPRKALQQPTLSDAIRAIVDARRIDGMNFLVVDRSGEYVNIETTSQEYWLTDTGDDCYAHTNHFLAPAFTFRTDYRAHWHSQLRLMSLNRFLKRQRGQIDRGSVKKALCSHRATLCNHGTGMTVTCMLCDLTAGCVAFSSGPPCLDQFQEFTL
ncbi:MAG: hypothetical protein HY321_10460 [Armatimonadetes bacterium]|nr:hypothetical protein [Armatimonadota bacterium]